MKRARPRPRHRTNIPQRHRRHRPPEPAQRQHVGAPTCRHPARRRPRRAATRYAGAGRHRERLGLFSRAPTTPCIGCTHSMIDEVRTEWQAAAGDPDPEKEGEGHTWALNGTDVIFDPPGATVVALDNVQDWGVYGPAEADVGIDARWVSARLLLSVYVTRAHQEEERPSASSLGEFKWDFALPTYIGSSSTNLALMQPRSLLSSYLEVVNSTAWAVQFTYGKGRAAGCSLHDGISGILMGWRRSMFGSVPWNPHRDGIRVDSDQSKPG